MRRKGEDIFHHSKKIKTRYSQINLANLVQKPKPLLNKLPIRSVISYLNDTKLEKIQKQKSSDSVYIICGGPSLTNFDFQRLADRDTIVVNSSLKYVPNPNWFVTVDYTFLRKFGTKQVLKHPVSKIFVADFSYPFIKEVNGLVVDTKFDLSYRDIKDFQIVKSIKQEGMGLTFSDFRSGKNSGYCALQLAVILGYKKIFLLGLDLNINSIEPTHYHGGYGEARSSFQDKLVHYFNSFRIGIAELKDKSDVQVFSCSKTSRLNDLIPYCEFE